MPRTVACDSQSPVHRMGSCVFFFSPGECVIQGLVSRVVSLTVLYSDYVSDGLHREMLAYLMDGNSLSVAKRVASRSVIELTSRSAPVLSLSAF